MSIIFQFGPSLLQSSTIPPTTTTCSAQAESVLRMGPGLENDSNLSVLSADESSVVDVSTSNMQLYSEKEDNVVSVSHHPPGSCFGLPYQDHNYGAPPPPTPPSQSPNQSPAHVSPVVETETVSIVTTTYENEDIQESSITRCVCGYDHDDEYMICCDQCSVWQHVDCMGLDRNNIPDTYLCEQCEPRKVDRQRAKMLQAKKKIALTEKLIFHETSDDSDADASNQNSESHLKNKSKSSKKKSIVDKADKDKSEQVVLKKAKSQSKHLKERMEMKRSKLRKRVKSKSESTCNAADEEAQDAWKCSMEWQKNCSENSYSDDIRLLASGLKNQVDEAKVMKQLQAQLCRVVDFSDGQKKLVADRDLSRDQLVVEWKGHFLSSSEFHQTHPPFKHRLFPFVLFYKLHSGEELCVDSTDCATDARFVRRSCTPNAEVKHLVLNGSLHLYISSTKDILKDEEITIPFDVDTKALGQDMSCACSKDSCILLFQQKNGVCELSEKRRRGKKQAHSTDDDSNQSSCTVMSPTKSSKGSPTKTGIISPKSEAVSDQNDKGISEEQETDEPHKEHKRKMTREERKIDAIMRAFDQMEKAAKRRQQALDRLAHQKLQNQKSEEPAEKQENAPSVIIKEEEKGTACPQPGENNNPLEEEKPATTHSSNSSRNKKGKRRRGSGTQTRKRTRTNSGGSDVFTADEASYCDGANQCLSSASSVETFDTACPESSVTPPATAQVPVSAAVLPKTKRFLHNEWLQEKAESLVPPSSPLPIRTELNWKVSSSASTCYVRCTKDNPTSGISAAHLRRSTVLNSHCKQTSGQGSAKKRWLRQAMYDCEPIESETINEGVNGETSSPMHSPHSQTETCSPGVPHQDDVVTPLKKRRIMRNSLSSSSAEWTSVSSEGVSPDHSSSEAGNDSLADPIHVVENLNVELSNNDCSVEKSGANGLSKHLLKSLRENWLRNENKVTDCVSKSGSSFGMPDSCLPETKTEQNGTGVHDTAQAKSENLYVSAQTPRNLEVGKCTIKTKLSSLSASPVLDSCLLSSVDKECSARSGVTESSVYGCRPISVSAKANELKTEADSVCEKDSCKSVYNDLSYEVQPLTKYSTDEGETETSECKTGNSVEHLVGKPCLRQPQVENCDKVVASTVLESNNSMALLGPQSEEVAYDQTVNISANSVSPCAQTCSTDAASSSSKESFVVNSECTSDQLPSVSSDSNSMDAHLPAKSTYAAQESQSEQRNASAQNESSTTASESTGSESCANSSSATRKRKVTLSEYRQRKRDNHNIGPVNNERKKSNNCVLKPVEELTATEEIKLAALPLFEKPAKAVKNESNTSDKKGNKTKEKKHDEHCASSSPPQKREKLADRLKREFGVEDVSDSLEENVVKTGAEHQKTDPSLLNVTSDVSPILSFCTQLPPPVLNTSAGPTQFSYAGAPQSYAQPTSFIMPQVPTGHYVDGQNPTGSSPLIPAMHPLGVAAAAAPPPLTQQGCTYSAAMHTDVARPPPHLYYPPANSQTFAVAQQPSQQHSAYSMNIPFKTRAYK